MTGQSPTRYDGMLAAMPVPVVAGAAAGWGLAIPYAVGVGLGSLLAGLLVVVSLFIVPPE